MDGDSINTVLQAMECPVCYEYFNPPIRICIDGHSLCSNCRSGVQECPLCKRSFTDGRNYNLEELVENIVLPCKNRSLGCEQFLKLCKRKEHEDDSCKYNPYHCIYCKFEISADDFVEHYTTCHKAGVSFRTVEPNSWETEGKTCIYKTIHSFDILAKETATGITHIKEHGIFVRRYLREGRVWHLWIGMVASQKSADKYIYKIELGDDEDSAISYTGRVHSLHKEGTEIIKEGLCLTLSQGLVIKLKDHHNRCPAEMSIIKK